ncbi:hypothetical protein Syun_012358 [Stephania yunnanensis]|uniref:Uncharacterized protein n=1 Tax=Stephania yunnanensis TaxID=152371 RepID=A0AAP0PF87_9MAGN
MGVLFTLPSRYYFAIGDPGVFSLAICSLLIHTGFHVPQATRVGAFMNLKEIVLQSNLYGIRDASIYFKVSRRVIALDIIPPPSVEIVDTIQHIATLTEPISFCIGFQIERNRGYHIIVTSFMKDNKMLVERAPSSDEAHSHPKNSNSAVNYLEFHEVKRSA